MLREQHAGTSKVPVQPTLRPLQWIATTESLTLSESDLRLIQCSNLSTGFAETIHSAIFYPEICLQCIAVQWLAVMTPGDVLTC